MAEPSQQAAHTAEVSESSSPRLSNPASPGTMHRGTNQGPPPELQYDDLYGQTVDSNSASPPEPDTSSSGDDQPLSASSLPASPVVQSEPSAVFDPTALPQRPLPAWTAGLGRQRRSRAGSAGQIGPSSAQQPAKRPRSISSPVEVASPAAERQDLYGVGFEWPELTGSASSSFSYSPEAASSESKQASLRPTAWGSPSRGSGGRQGSRWVSAPGGSGFARSPGLARVPEAGPEAAARSNEVVSLQRRLSEAEAQLRTALREVQLWRARSQQDLSLAQTQAERAVPEAGPSATPPSEGVSSILRPAWDGFIRGFGMAYTFRAGMGLTTRALTLMRARRFSEMYGWKVLSERNLVYREDAVRLGLFIGGFNFVYHAITATLQRYRPAQPGGNCLIAGALAGTTLLFQGAERRRTLALYMLARLAQCAYNSLKERGAWHFWGSDWGHGDSLLFAVCSAQVMYAYVMRPETLPQSFWRFIVKSGPIDPVILEAIRRNVRGLPVDVQAVNDFVRRHGGRILLASPFPRQIPDKMLHPRTPSALRHNAWAFWGTYRKTFPLYLSLSLVPYVILNLKKALRQPLITAAHALASALRSTAFLSSFVLLYQATVSAHRKLFGGDSKFLYYIAGLVASLAVLVEKKVRRSELALYVMPRAVDSAVLTALDNKWAPSLKFGEVALFCACMGGLMYYREHEPHTMAPLLNVLISRIVFGKNHRSARTALPKPAAAAPATGTAAAVPEQELLTADTTGTALEPPLDARPSMPRKRTLDFQPGDIPGTSEPSDWQRVSPEHSPSPPDSFEMLSSESQ